MFKINLVLPNIKHDYSFETSKRLIKLLSSSINLLKYQNYMNYIKL